MISANIRFLNVGNNSVWERQRHEIPIRYASLIRTDFPCLEIETTKKKIQNQTKSSQNK